MSQIVQVGVGIVLSASQDAVLACRRRGDDYWGGWWEFPGGKCNPGESPRECVIRELREELGIDVRPIEPLSQRQHHYADRDLTVHLHPFLCELISGNPAALEVDCFRWCRMHDLADLKFLPANGPMLEELEKLMRSRSR